MATDSTNLPQGETRLHVDTDMSGSELDLTSVQMAQTEPAEWVDLPKGNVVILLPVQPGQTVRLPTASASGLLAKIGPEGNLAIVVDGRTIILQGYVNAYDQSPIKIVTNDGDTVDVAELIAATDPSLDIQTAAGPATGGQGDGPDGSGIYVPFAAGPGLGGLNAIGILDPTALQYRLIDDEQREFTLDEDTSPDFTISFDILGGIVNEDDLGPDKQIEQPGDVQIAKFVFDEGGNNGEGNDPFDTKDREKGSKDNPPDDLDDEDANANGADPDREPLSTVATVKVDFHGDVPGKLEVDLSKLPIGLTSEGELISYAIDPAQPGVHGNGIFGYVENNKTPGYQEGEDRLVFEVHVDKYTSDSEFKVTFTLHDNIDNAAPDENGDGAPDLLGANEQLLDLPVHFKITDSDGSGVTGTLPLGVQDDVPAFGEVVGVGADMKIIDTIAEVTHDETKGEQGEDGADDQSFFDFVPYFPFIEPNIPLIELAADLYEQVIVEAGFSLPFGDSKGALLGAAQTQVKVSFGADGASEEYAKADGDASARDSIFGAINGTGENERPFELFMIDPSKGSTPTEDNKSTLADEGNLTVSEQKTNATVTWNGSILPVYMIQIDPNTIVGYIKTGEGGGEEIEALDIGSGKEAVFVINIDDAGVLSFFQLHQINHPDPTDSNEGFQILAEDGETPLVHVRATDYDGDHATQAVTVQILDDGPKFIKVCYDHGNTVDEDWLPGGNGLAEAFFPPLSAPGDDPGFTFVSGKINFSIGADKPGVLSFGELVITNSKGEPVDITELKTADSNNIELKPVSGPDGDGIVAWEGVEVPGGATVFTITLDTSGSGMGNFKFTLHQALQHPFTDSDLNNDDNPETRYEDDFNFAFNVIATDGDKDTAQGTIKIVVDDDSPKAFDDHDVVTEGKTGSEWNYASGNVVTGGDSNLLGKDANFTFLPPLFTGDGTPDLPGADRPYTISKLVHGTDTYNLVDHGEGASPRFEVTKNGGDPLGAGESFDEASGILTIPTDKGGTFEIVMESANLSAVGEYKYTVPQDADHDIDYHIGPVDLANSLSDDFNSVGEWVDAFDNGGITIEPIGGSLAIKSVDVQGAPNPNYRGIGVSSGGGDEAEVDTFGQGGSEGLKLTIQNDNFPGGVNNASLLLGALFNGEQFDNSFQEILQWEVFLNGVPVASGQIVGDFDGLVTLDIDTGGAKFNEIVLKPLDNGAPGNHKDWNSDFQLISVEICKPLDKFEEEFDYTLRDSDGDESTATLSIDVKDTEPKFRHGGANISFKVDEDGIAGGNKDVRPGDITESTSGGNVDNDGIHIGKINFTPGFDPVSIELTVGNGGDTGLDTVDGKNVFAAWDAATSTLIGYIEGTDPSDAANRVFTMKVDNHQTGDFTFKLLKPVEHPDSDQSGDDNENNPDLSFVVNIQIEDKDCDVIHGKATVTIDDDMPVITQQSSNFALAVDESLDGNSTPSNAGDHPHNPGTRIEDDEDGAGLPGVLTGLGSVIGASKSSGSSLFSFSAGADGLQSEVYSLTLSGSPLATGLIDSQSGTAISLHSFPDGTVRGISASGHLVFAFSINSTTGEVSMAQYRAINHGGDEDAPGNHDEVAVLGTGGLSVTLTVTDKDDDTVSSSVDITGKVTFDDDGPKAKIDKKYDNEVLHDESAGLQNDDQPNGSLPGVFSNVGLIGWARSDDPVVTTFGSEYGTDGAGTTVLSLKVSSDGVNSGLDDTATGNNILLFQNGSIVEGRVEGSNELVFAISLNQNGTIDVAQYRAIEHPNPNDHDEDVGINNSALQAWVTVTDKDGDVATDSVSIGSRVRFDDDGPNADIDLLHDAKIVLDESKGAAAADGFPDGNAFDEDGNVIGDIAYGTIAGKALFVDKSSFGTDGPGTKLYSLAISGEGTNSGLFDSETNATIRLYQVNATTIEGRPQVSGPDPLSFRITIDPVTGNVTVSQFRAVEHNNNGSSASDHDESGSPEIMDHNKLFVRQTVTDGDKDHDSDLIDLGKIIKFEDDGPIARNDVDALDSIAGNKFEAQGNVITGGGVTTPGIDDGGTDTPWVISNLVGSKSSDSNPSGGFNVTGTYGTLSMNSSGQYTYNFDEANWAGKVASGSTEVFTYTLRDSDSDTDTATLTINMGEATVETRAIVNPAGADCILEDTYTPVVLSATPGTGDTVTQIVLSNVPAGWDVKDDSNADFSIGGPAFIIGTPTFVGNQIVFNIGGASPGDPVAIQILIKAAPDSDADGSGLTVSATVVDGVVFAKDDTNFDVIVDAVADGDDKGDDGDADKLGVAIEVTDGGDADATFQFAEVGNVKVTASYDDFQDGSETHTLTVQAPVGFVFVAGNVGTVPPGVELDLLNSDTDTLVFKIDSKDGDGQNGLGSFELNIPVIYAGGQPDGESGNFSATATATEGNVVASNGDGNDECTDANNTDSASATDKAGIATVPVPNVRLGVEGNEDVICINEDAGPTNIVIGGSTTAGSHITQIVLSDFPVGGGGFTYDFTTLDSFATVTNDIATNGTVTVVFDSDSVNSFSLHFKVTPPADSDLDLGLLTATITAVHNTDPTLTGTDADQAYVRVDAVADGDDVGDDGDADVLGVTIDVQDSNDGGPAFHAGETGNVKVTASFDDFKDGSETHTLTVTAPAGFTFGAPVAPLPAGVSVFSNDGTTVVFTVDSKDGNGQDGVGDFELNIPVTYAGGQAEGSSGNFTATVTATETPSDAECTEANNTDSATETDTAVIATPPVPNVRLGVEGNTDFVCVPEDSAGVDIPIVASTTAGSHLTTLVISGFPVGGAGFTFGFSALDTIGTIANNIGVDGTVTITFDAPLTGFGNFFKVIPPADSDFDLGLLTATITAVHDLDSSVTGTDADQAYVRVDAVADGKGPGFGDDGDGDVLSISIVADDSGSDGIFATGETGTLTLNATFDDYKDGSEAHQITISAPAGFQFTGGFPGGLPVGVTVDPSSTAANLVLNVDSKDGDGVNGVGSISGLQIEIKNVSAPSETTANFTATATAVEQNTTATNDDDNKECTDDNNSQSVAATAEVQTLDNFIPTAVDDDNTATNVDTNYQLMLVLDRSGSMDDIVPNSGGKTRFELARDSLISLIEKYQGSTNGTVNIKLVLFNNGSAFAGGSGVGTFISANAAIAYLQGLSPTFGDNGTDYDAALWDALQGINDASWSNADADTQSFVYWVSDGRPTEVGNSNPEVTEFPGGDNNNQINNVEQAAWEAKLDEKGVKSIAIGIGTDIVGDAQVADQLSRVAHDPGVPNSGLVQIIDDINALTAALVATVPAPVSGNLLGNDFPGDASDPLSGGVVSIVDLTDPDAPVAVTQDQGATWKIETNLGILVVTKATGAYTYTPKPGSEGKTDTFQYTIQDTIGADTDTATLTITIESTAQTIDGNDSANTLAGGLGNDTLNGKGGNDVLWGGEGDDTINGGDGNDRIYGGAGNDQLNGGANNDTYIVLPGDGKDTISDSAGTDAINLLGGPLFLDASRSGNNLILQYGLTGLTDQITVTNHFTGTNNVETITIIDGPFAGTYNLGTDASGPITGSSNDDVLAGTGGNETFDGEGGDDLIFGQAGTDTLNGESGNDYLDGGNDLVADTLNGGDNDDILVWRGTADTYNGGSGVDTLLVSHLANVDFTAVIDSKINDVERIDMRGGSGTTVTLNSQDLLDLETGTTFNPSDGGFLPTKASIQVDGDSGDTLQLSSGVGEWIDVTGSISNEPNGYKVYAFDTNASPGAQPATVQGYVIVHEDITVNIV